jgi:hypothetical protein
MAVMDIVVWIVVALVVGLVAFLMLFRPSSRNGGNSQQPKS